jgi:hypothetical protein
VRFKKLLEFLKVRLNDNPELSDKEIILICYNNKDNSIMFSGLLDTVCIGTGNHNKYGRNEVIQFILEGVDE